PAGGGVPLNADPALEAEARTQGARAAQGGRAVVQGPQAPSPRVHASPAPAVPVQAANGHDDEEDQGQQTPLMLTMEPWSDLESTGRATPWGAMLPGPRQLLEPPRPLLPTPLGPSTTGIASPESREKLATKGSGLLNFLKRKDIPPDKLREMQTKAVNTELTRPETGVPEITSKFTLLPQETGGSMDSESWSLNLNQSPFSGGSPLSRVTTTMNTTTHESRHGEQYFRVARLLAAGGATPEQIREQTELPMEIILKAIQNPLEVPPTGRTREMHEAESWYHSLHGKDAPQRRQTLRDFHASEKIVAQEKLNSLMAKGNLTSTALLHGSDEERLKGPKGEMERAIQDLELAQTLHEVNNDEYRALPEEVDAWELGDDVERRIREKDRDG
ncbi:MAG: hypothetical protein ACLGI9_24145, partial [Thermoanaerobaculia bacterium]